MHRHHVLTVAVLAALALAMPQGAALHCNGDITAIPLATETLYIDHRHSEPGDVDTWLYLESNGVEGLQSGDDGIYIDECVWVCWYDPCQHASPDTLIAIAI